MIRRHAVILALVLGSGLSAALGAGWESTLSAAAPGSFQPPRPLHTKYRFGWSGFTAGTLDIRLTQPTDDRFQVDATGHTIGLARELWKFDANNTSIADAATLHPIEVRQTETTRKKKTITNLNFESKGVISRRVEIPGKNEGPKLRRFDFPNLFDLQSALLYVRSQPLSEGSIQRLVVYPADSAYLATITGLGHTRLTTAVGTFNAIKIDLQLNKIRKDRELEPHRKFRRATAWVSDDADRLVLKIEAQLFVGTVSADLQSFEFESAKARAN